MGERWKLYCGDAKEALSGMGDESVDCCVTSPPYYALRDYGYDGQIGLEDTPEEYVSRLVDVFHEVRRVLKPHGTCWVNIGDSYNTSSTGSITGKKQLTNVGSFSNLYTKKIVNTCKPKDLIGVPWMLAFALREDGWYLRNDIIWAKPNCMPESITDRCTKSHEHIFFLSKSLRYYYDSQAICEESGANKRDVWSVPIGGGYSDDSGAHYATYSPKLIEPCILAGCPDGGVVLDPFSGTGTTGVVALRAGRTYIGIDMGEQYIEMQKRRLERETSQMSLFWNYESENTGI